MWFLHTHSEQSVLLSLAAGQTKYLPSCLLPHSFTVVVKLLVCKGHPLLSWPSMLTFILSVLLLMCNLTITSPRERDRHLYWFFFCSPLGHFSTHSTNAFTHQWSWRVVWNMKHLVDLVQACSLTLWSRISNSLLVALLCKMILDMRCFNSLMHMSS